ncbi:MAG: transporter-like protein, partial [Alphaproteobacteria bacterium]|nr:transporter-like protein [Alphaproteobacteria bacterium]
SLRLRGFTPILRYGARALRMACRKKAGLPRVIEILDVSKRYAAGAHAALHGLSLAIAEGEFLALIGPSGCGKTTTLGLINRLVEPSQGTVRIGGRDIAASDPAALRRGIGYVFQEAGLFPHLTVAGNIAVTPRLLGWDPALTLSRVMELLALVKLDPERFADRMPHELSGGQRQRVALARALAARPPILLLDEPFGALDPLTRDEVAQDVKRIHGELGLTTVMVTHDMTEALLLADRIAVMRDGHLVQLGTPRELVAHPADDFVSSMLETPRRRAAALAAALA